MSARVHCITYSRARYGGSVMACGEGEGGSCVGKSVSEVVLLSLSLCLFLSLSLFGRGMDRDLGISVIT